MSLLHDQLKASTHLHLIARENRGQNRKLQVVHFSFVGESPEILRQTRPSECKAGGKIRRGNVELSVLTEDFHDLVRVEAHRFAEISDLIRKPDLERMPAVVDVLDHLSSLQVRPDQGCVEFFVKRRQDVSAGFIYFADDRLRRATEIL